MGQSYFSSVRERNAYYKEARESATKAEVQAALILTEQRTRLAAKIVMTIVDQIVAQIVRPGPKPEERECYEMAGEMRAIVPELEALAKAIIDVNNGCP